MTPGLRSADRPVVSQKEVAASFTRSETQVKKAVTKEQIEWIRKIQQEKAKAGGKSAALELAKQDLESRKTVSRWEGGQGKPVGDLFDNKNIGKEVADQVDTINKVKQGLEILAIEGPRRAKYVADLKANGTIGASETVNTLTKTATETIAKMQILEVMFPDIAAAGLTTAQKIDWVEYGLARDPVLRNAISEMMGAWQAKILTFPEVPATQVEQSKQELKAAQEKKQHARENMDSVIKDTLGIKKKLLKVQEESITKAMDMGDKDMIVNILAEAQGITAKQVVDVKAWKENTKKLAEFRDKKANTTPATTQYDAEIDRLEKIVDQIKYPTVKAPSKLGDFDILTDVVNGPIFSSNLDAFKEQSESVRNLSSTKLKKTDKELMAEFARKDKEQSALNELNTILESALITAYDQREAQLVDAKQTIDQMKLDDATKAGRMDEAKMRASRANRWIEKKGQGIPEEVHTSNIREDINLMREYGQIGIKLMIARDSGIITKKEFEAVRDHKKSAYIALAEVTNEDNQRLEKLTQIEGIMDDYRDTLMTNYLRANKYIKQGIVGRVISYGVGDKRTIKLDDDSATNWGDYVSRARFALRPNEWEDLYGHFDDSIRTAIDKSKDAQSFLNRLRSEGVVSEPKLRWLMYIMALMGIVAIPGLGIGGLAGAAVGAPGIGAMAGLGAVEAAAIGVGNATKNTYIQ